MANNSYQAKAPRLPAPALLRRNIHPTRPLSEKVLGAEIIIGINLRNQGHLLGAALESALAQTVVTCGLASIIILDDDSTDQWQAACGELLGHPQVALLAGTCGSAARARNGLLDFVDQNLPRARWVARLDADDTLASPDSVAALCRAGDHDAARYIIGSNHLVSCGESAGHDNIAKPEILKDRRLLLQFINAFCTGTQQQELPSCNLVLRCRSGIRYPDIRSAEDHWLVASLLLFSPCAGTIAPFPIYCYYSLSGEATDTNKSLNEWGLQRRRLAEAARLWVDALESDANVLGLGQEGVVTLNNGLVTKYFYPLALDSERAAALQNRLMRAERPVAPPVEWSIRTDDVISCSYPMTPLAEIDTNLTPHQVKEFLSASYRSKVVMSNINRSNLRIAQDGKLHNIDIGSDIVDFTTSRFLDSAARLYAIGVLGYPDQELARRVTSTPQHETLNELPGFSEFYRELIEELHPHCLLTDAPKEPDSVADGDTTLLIKACAQDADTLRVQVRHIVTQLSFPRRFTSVVLVIDPFEGPFLRQYANGNLDAVLAIATELKAERVIDDFRLAPNAPEVVRQTYRRWFADDTISETHTTGQAPLHSQLWAFDQVGTRHVLQCDSDVLIGRQDLQHDFLADMKAAINGDNVISVGFNIPQRDSGFNPYRAPQGGFVPEVRFCLLDLGKIRAQMPIDNPTSAGRFQLMWHRALQRHQERTGLCSLRGGDSRSFYIHPKNEHKSNQLLPIIRDLVAQSVVPSTQQLAFDLVIEADWAYPARHENIVFLLKGKDTGRQKLSRCIGSLHRQVSQAFGVIVIDDGGDLRNSWFIPELLGPLRERTTLIRRQDRAGYLPNFIQAVEGICRNPDSLIVVLDQDDVLMSDQVVSLLMDAHRDGVDLINGSMFRPDKPLHTYPAAYNFPRSNGGGNTWAHMRAFRKALFEEVPGKYFKRNGEWIDNVTDFATMLPMAELSQNPKYMDDVFFYYHQRDAYSPTRKSKQTAILKDIFSLPALNPCQPTVISDPALAGSLRDADPDTT